MRTLLALLLATGPAFAEEPLTAEDFDALTRGRSMTWAEFGTVYGVEQYLPDRRVRWAVVGDDCKTGHWYADGPAICFKYEDDIEPDCWIITRSGDGFSARYTLNPPEAEPVTVTETLDPPACFGPEVGV
ncbi:hypothetical protein [Rhodobacter sp. SY28-1]|uniref:hypothetical protein n=1 Tax=Rhodobacter sp. SY28-1 TaxID=2562317 RepID=UPI0010C157B2|nr:hypothetical protein [Rhodobacter sp. SY28-1]